MTKCIIKAILKIVNQTTIMISLASLNGCALLPTPDLKKMVLPDTQTTNKTSLYTNLQAGDNALINEDIGDREGIIVREGLIIISKPTESPFEINYVRHYERSWLDYLTSLALWTVIGIIVISVLIILMFRLSRRKRITK